MILKSERVKMKRLLKGKYIDDVLTSLKEKNITNNSNQPFSKAFISQVFNGKEEHFIIEEVILKLYNKRKRERAKMKLKKNNILKSKIAQ